MHRKLLMLALLAAALGGCGTPAPTQSGSTQNTVGGYVAPKNSEWYRTEGGNLYAWDGTAWFILRAPEHAAGDISGATVGTPEWWASGRATMIAVA